MALRSLGSSLVAKASPGAALRKTQEARAEMPPVPEVGQMGSLSRMGMEQPLTRQVPAGSQKIVSIQPTIEGTQVAPGVIPGEVPSPIPGVGVSAERATPSVPSGSQNQALFQGGVGAPAARAASQPAKTVSVAGGAKPAVAYQPKPTYTEGEVQGAQSQFQGQPSQQQAEIVKPYLSVSGTKAYAGEGGNLPSVLRPTTVQQAAGKVGKVLTTVGNMFNAPQLVPGGLGAKLQTFGGAPTLAKMGVGSVTKAVQQATSQLRSQINNFASGLRSLFGRR